jgi:hypothetical protein
MVNKGYFTFSTSVAHFINTHLSPSSIDLLPTKEEHQIRKEEQLRILNRAEEYSSEHAKPIFISGDYNTNMGPLFDKATYCSEATPQGFSETEYLINRNWNHNTSAQPNGQALDYFLSFFQYLKITTKVIPTFNTDLPQNAISDHPALYSEIDLS